MEQLLKYGFINILLYLLFPVSYLSSQVYVYNAGSYNYTHDSTVAEYFKSGYGTYTGVITIGGLTLAQASALGYKYYIRSYTGFSQDTSTARLYERFTTAVYPTGSNDYVRLITLDSNNMLKGVILTGGGNSALTSAYSVEFWSNVSVLSSWSNGYIAGQLAYIQDQLGCTLFEARYRARKTASNAAFSNVSGYGIIDKEAAVSWVGVIPDNTRESWWKGTSP